jgi:carbon-monoxide dehydrogenase small subunit
MRIDVTVNGTRCVLDVPADLRLIDLLRDELGLTGTKEACGEGECGACTVIVDGRAVNSCLALAVQVRGKSVLTVEGLAEDGRLSVLQQKFIENMAVQCGYCTPGMLMSAKALLMAEPEPSEEQIRMALAGNLCRCTGYTAIVAAVKDAAAEMASAQTTPDVTAAAAQTISPELAAAGLTAVVVPGPAAAVAGVADATPRDFPAVDTCPRHGSKS